MMQATLAHRADAQAEEPAAAACTHDEQVVAFGDVDERAPGQVVHGLALHALRGTRAERPHDPSVQEVERVVLVERRIERVAPAPASTG